MQLGHAGGGLSSVPRTHCCHLQLQTMDQQDMTSLAHPGGGQLLADAATAATCSTAGCYVKQLSPSDAACSKQIKLPKAEARRLLGELRHKQRALVVSAQLVVQLHAACLRACT